MQKVEENLNLGAYTRRKQSGEVAEAKERVFKLFPILKSRRRQLAGTLSGGEQQMLSIGRALMSTPKVMLLDEPSLGLSPILVKQILVLLKSLCVNPQVARGAWLGIFRAIVLSLCLGQQTEDLGKYSRLAV